MKKQEVYWIIAIAVLVWFMYGSYQGGKAVASYQADPNA